MRSTAWLFLSLLTVAGCESAQESAAGGWVGTIMTEGNITTVVNESGSVWGGPATLVEEASIGVEAGDEQMMFGLVRGLWATDDLLYIADSQVPAIRVFDHDGNWLRDLGQQGEGPGEYVRISQFMVAEDGRLFLYDVRSGRVNIYSPEGQALETWTDIRLRGAGGPATLTKDGVLYVDVFDRGPDPSARGDDINSMVPIDANGATGAGLRAPLSGFETAYVGPREARVQVPYSGTQNFMFTPTREWIVGVSSEYRFEIHRPDGSQTIVKREGARARLPEELGEHMKRRRIAEMRQRSPDWGWDGTPLPEFKSAYWLFRYDHSGRILVQGEGASEPIAGCYEDPEDLEPVFMPRCWDTELFWDVFEMDGKFLGRVEIPQWPVYRLFARGDKWWAAVQDEMGTIMVKRYRLLLPGEE